MRSATSAIDVARIRRHTAILLAALLSIAPVLGLAKRADAVSDDEVAFAAMVNDVRERAGKRQLRVNDRLSTMARRHSARMAARGQLFHSDLRRVFRRFNYRLVGENVGYGGSLDQLLQAFLDSAPHRANLVGRYRKTGVGVYWKGDRVWVTQLFYR